MSKILLKFTTIAIILLLSACSNDEIIEKNNNNPAPNTGRTLSLTATMPGDKIDVPTTRVDLEQLVDKSIVLTWEKTDELQLAFVQGETKIKSTATMMSISDDGKKAEFEILIPDGISDNLFDLYGVYGGGGLDDADPTKVILPTSLGSAGSLAAIKNRKDVMLHFTSKNVKIANPQVSVVFKHLGSLFSITFADAITQDILDQIEANNIAEARLVGVDNEENKNWAYNAGAGGNKYDLVTGEFQNTEASGNYISLSIKNSDLTIGEPLIAWGWYPPLTDVNWPELSLELRSTSDAVVTASINRKTARTAPTAAGQSYYFYAAWKGSQLNFTNESFTPILRPTEYWVMPMGSLKNKFSWMVSDTITTMIIRGEMNKADFDVLKKDMRNLTYLDLSNVICEGNKIPDNAFGEYQFPNRKIKTIILPKTVTKIGENAFQYCSGLTGTLVLPNGLTSIGNSAFSKCSGLTGSLIIPDEVTTISDFAFQGCSSLTGLKLPEIMTEIGKSAFAGCTSLTGSLSIPDGVTTISDNAFQGCSGLTGSINLPAKIKTIGRSAFEGCSGLTGTLAFPDWMTTISAYAFNGCSGLTGTLNLPKDLTTISHYAFKGCSGLTGSLAFPDGFKAIGESAFDGCEGFSGIVLFPISIESLGENVFAGCSNIGAYRFSQTTLFPYNKMFPRGATVQVPLDAVKTYKQHWYWNDSYNIIGIDPTNLPDVYYVETMGSLSTLLGTKKRTITAMKLRGFINSADFNVMKQEMPKLRYLDLQHVTCDGNKIPENAFGNSNSKLANQYISTIILPQNIKTIGVSAFHNCTGLKNPLIIPQEVSSIGKYAYKNCSGFNAYYPSYNLTEINEGVFHGCSGFTNNLGLGNKITTIKADAFRDCSGFTGVLIFSSTPKKIESHAFYGCKNLDGKVIFQGKNHTISMENHAFYGCDKIPFFDFESLSTPFPYTTNMLPLNAVVKAYMIFTFENQEGWKNHTLESSR